MSTGSTTGDDVPKPQYYYTYHQTPEMFGEYSKQVGEFARMEGLTQEGGEKKKDKALRKELGGYPGKVRLFLGFIWRNTVCRVGEDWVFLTLLAIIMAFTGFIIDRGINICNQARNWLYQDISSYQHHAAQYFAWVSLPVVLILFAAAFVKIMSPQAIGSGIPEMKTVLNGAILKEYLTVTTLISKLFGLTATLGSGMPLGKEGPFIHISSMYSVLLSRIVAQFQGIYKNEVRATEMMAAACALGVACCFGAPIGGVLFTIEVTSSYYYVRNYWRAFYAAVWGTTIIRLLAVWCTHAPTLTPMFKTNFFMDVPYDAQELLPFALIGISCGIGGGMYVIIHRNYVKLLKKTKPISKFMAKYPFFYPGFISLLTASVMFPPGSGQYMAAHLSSAQQMIHLFSNFPWSGTNLTLEQHKIVANWTTYRSGIFCHLSVLIAFTFFFSILCLTMPVPCGCFVPIFKIGACFGRIIGELMYTWYPDGIYYFGKVSKVVPGGYAIVGAAAFSGAVTHTISTSLIAFELSGEITHLIPTLIATIISNSIACLFAPSMYDSVIMLKKLPFLPDLLPSTSAMYSIYVEDFMIRDVVFIYHKMTYEEIKQILLDNRKLTRFPLVDSPKNRILLGSIQRMQLIKLLEKQVGRGRRLQEARRRVIDAQEEERKAQTLPTSDILVIRPPGKSPVEKKPVKSILMYTNRYARKGFTSPFLSTNMGTSPYTTISASENKMRTFYENLLRKSNWEGEDEKSRVLPKSGKFPKIIPSKKVRMADEVVYDLTAEEQNVWEKQQLQEQVNFSDCRIDPSPFQLVERTSLLKVHSMFAMMGVEVAYVTNIGKLVGVVGLKELRKAIEDANSGKLKPHDLEIPLM